MRQHVSVLPGEIVTRNIQQHFGLAARIGGFVAEILAADVHVRRQVLEGHFVMHHPARLHLVRVGTGGNDETVVADANGGDYRLRRLLGEDDADRGLVRGGLAVGGVVHLEHHVAAGFDAQSLAGSAGKCGGPGCVGREPVAGTPIGRL